MRFACASAAIVVLGTIKASATVIAERSQVHGPFRFGADAATGFTVSKRRHWSRTDRKNGCARVPIALLPSNTCCSRCAAVVDTQRSPACLQTRAQLGVRRAIQRRPRRGPLIEAA